LLNIPDSIIIRNDLDKNFFLFEEFTMKKLLILAALCGIFTACSGDKSKSDEKGAFEKGMAFLKEGKIEKARRTFAEIDTISPGSPYAQYGQALVFQKEKLIFEAMEAYEKLLYRHSGFAPAIQSYAELAIEMGRDELSVGLAERNIKAGGETGKNLSLKIEALLAAGEMERASQAVEDALSLRSDDPYVLLSSAKLYFHMGDYAKSRELAGRARFKTDLTPEVLSSLAEYYAQIGFSDSSAEILNMLLDASNDDFYAKGAAAAAFIKIHYYFAARKILKEMESMADSSHLQILLNARLYEEQGKMDKAKKIYQAAMIKYPKTITAQRNMAGYKFKTFEAMTAEAYMGSVILQAEERGYPADEIMHLALDHIEGLIYQGKMQKTTQMVMALVDSLPPEFRMIKNAAQVYLMFGGREEAARILKQLERMGSGNSVRQAKIGNVYENADSLKAAERHYQSALALDKANLPAIVGLASIYKKRNDIEGAINFLKGLDQELLNIPQIAYKLIELYESSGRLDMAFEISYKQVELAYQDLERYRISIKLAEQLKNREKGEELVNLCLEKNPDNPESQELAGRFYLASGNINKAQEASGKALSLNPAYIDGLILQAEIDTAQGKTDRAMEIYEKALELDKESDAVRSGLAWLMAERGGDYRAAANHAMAALAEDARNPKYYLTLGWVYYKEGRFNMARGNFEKALKFLPDDPVYNYYAGLGYWKDKKPDKAKECLQKALSLGLGGKLGEEAKSIMGKL
jgi:tetratricopeptide (TPR) repeat protein